MCRAILLGMGNRRNGHITNLSPVAGFTGSDGFAYHSATKLEVEGFFEVLAKEVGRLDIHVIIIEPCTDLFGANRGMVSSNFPVAKAGLLYSLEHVQAHSHRLLCGREAADLWRYHQAGLSILRPLKMAIGGITLTQKP